MTDAHGRIQYLLALEYGSGKMKLQHCLGQLLEKIMALFGIKGNKYRRLRKRIVIRIDAGGGTPRNMGILEGSWRDPGGIWIQLLSKGILVLCSM
jgi:hypothetical protein